MREEGDLVGNRAREICERFTNIWRVVVSFVRILCAVLPQSTLLLGTTAANKLTLRKEAFDEPASMHRPSSQVQCSLREVVSAGAVSAVLRLLRAGNKAPSRPLDRAAL